MAGNADVSSTVGTSINPAELKIDLLCRGAVVDDSCRLKEDGRPICNTRADLASGLEMILPGEMRELWVNVPVKEKFVEKSPYRLVRTPDGYQLRDESRRINCKVKLAPKADWYDTRTKRGIRMSQIGTLQGTILILRLGTQQRFWGGSQEFDSFQVGTESCGSPQPADATVEDVVETAAMAQKKSGVTFVLVRGGYPHAGGLTRIFPYLEALKGEVGILVGVQFPPEEDLSVYDQACTLGVDHLSFCLDLFNKEYIKRYVPGRFDAPGQDIYFRAIGHCAGIMGKGRTSGEIVAGLEPVENSLRAIDYFVSEAVLPLVCILRPLQGTILEDFAPPRTQEMLDVFRHVYRACRAQNLPLGMAPNIQLSVLPHPEDTLYLAPDSSDCRVYQRWNQTMRQVMRPYFLRRMRKNRIPKE